MLIVEDGTGLADADSYCSVAYADAYHAAMGSAAWAALTAEAKEQALRRAAAFMSLHLGGRSWAGRRSLQTQALDGPRTDVPDLDFGGVISPDIVPAAIKKACAELAGKSAGGVDIAPDLGQAVKAERVGPIAVTYADAVQRSTVIQSVALLLAPFIQSSGAGFGSINVTRA